MGRESQDRVDTDGRKVERNMSQGRWIVLLAVVMFLGGIAALVVGIVLGVKATEVQKASCQSSVKEEELITTTPLPPTTHAPGPTASVSIEGHYRYAAVATDTQICSTVGTDIMGRKGGSVVDAAIATLLCVGAANLMSNGLGGGHFMTIYLRNSSKVYTIIAREMAPSAATEDMYIGLKGYNNAVEGQVDDNVCIDIEVSDIQTHALRKITDLLWSGDAGISHGVKTPLSLYLYTNPELDYQSLYLYTNPELDYQSLYLYTNPELDYQSLYLYTNPELDYQSLYLYTSPYLDCQSLYLYTNLELDCQSLYLYTNP
ncbi:uncharacterized protein LOC121385084 [Gigantopelta aegis]|uniref:uncharacterized protein LOC121385084 n=1 Tax=Gigantopelta aegis TaxID=1735272 RepID=UPI001B88BD3C|nr:uncharacterized protein LOC121385084 [Gigantopelta aegis]